MNFCTQFRALATTRAVVSISTSLILVGSVGAETMNLAPKTGLPALQYTNAPSKIPSYAAGAKWGTPGEAINQMQTPLSPADSARRVVTRPGFTATLWAAEPDILKPICMAWDERGRLWIAETIDYPNELQQPGLGRDRIKICEDTDGDGKADKFTVFAEKLSIPTAMCFANGGLIVFEAGHALFLKDTDGDGKADERRVLFEGWGMEDTHATANNLRYGLDNWIWGTVGYSGFKGEVGGKKMEFGMGVFRFKPDGSAMEFIKSSNNNTWGFGFSEEGIVFGSTANNNASWYMPIPNRYYEAVSGWGASRMETIADSQAYYPIAQNIRQVDAHGKYTAGAGHALYTARSFPQDYWNKVAFVTEPTGHLIGQFRLESDGSAFHSRNEHNFLASDDEWFAPIAADVGPDGAVWMLDWYNYIIQHNPTPAGFENGKGNAYVTPLRDKRHGRIYRVAWNEGKPSVQPDLKSMDVKQWVKALGSDNQLWRMHAQRLLVERGQMDVVPALQAMVKDMTFDEIGLNAGAIHALWTINGLLAKDSDDEVLLKTAGEAIGHPSAGVRRAGLMTLPRTQKAAAYLVAGRVLRDADAQVRLAAFLAVAEMPVAKAWGEAVFMALQEAKYFKRADEVNSAGDRWIPDAAAAAGARHAEGFLRAAAAWSFTVPESVRTVVRVVAAHAAQRSEPGVLAGLLLKLNGGSPAATAIVDGLASGSNAEHSPKMGEEQKETLVALMKALPVEGRSSLLDLGGHWGFRGILASEISAVSQALGAQVADANLPTTQRVDVARRAVSVDDSSATVQLVLAQINPLVDPALASGLLSAVAESRDASTAGSIVGAFPKFSPAARRTAISALLRRAEWSQVLLSAVESHQLQKTDLANEHWNQLKNSRNAEVSAKAKLLDATPVASSADMEQLIKTLMPVALKTGDAAHGKEIFTAQCAVCHMINGVGGRIGPDLSGIGARAKQDFMVDIIDPNRSVEANYRMWTVTTKSGDTFSGRLDTETETGVEILDTAGQKHAVQRKDITELSASNLSIMPAGFGNMPPDDFSALLEFIASSRH